VAIGLLLLSAACGGSSGSQTQAPPTSPTSPSPAPNEPIFEQPPRGDLLTRLDCSPSSFPNCGWGHRGDNPHHTLTRVGNGARFTLIPGSAAFLTQFYMGWSTAIPQIESGQAVYIRMRLRAVGSQSSVGVGDVWTNKFVILGDGSDSRSRVIIEMRQSLGDSLATRIQRNIDGDDARTPLVDLPRDVPVSLQYEARSGDRGRVAVWMNNNTYGAPAATSPIFALSSAAWSNINVGFYSNATLAPSGRIVFEVTDLEVGTGFDPTWAR
jgi:hypothetical protein